MAERVWVVFLVITDFIVYFLRISEINREVRPNYSFFCDCSSTMFYAVYRPMQRDIRRQGVFGKYWGDLLTFSDKPLLKLTIGFCRRCRPAASWAAICLE